MTVNPSINPALPWAEQIERAEPDLLRQQMQRKPGLAAAGRAADQRVPRQQLRWNRHRSSSRRTARRFRGEVNPIPLRKMRRHPWLARMRRQFPSIHEQLRLGAIRSICVASGNRSSNAN